MRTAVRIELRILLLPAKVAPALVAGSGDAARPVARPQFAKVKPTGSEAHRASLRRSGRTLDRPPVASQRLTGEMKRRGLACGLRPVGHRRPASPLMTARHRHRGRRIGRLRKLPVAIRPLAGGGDGHPRAAHGFGENRDDVAGFRLIAFAARGAIMRHRSGDVHVIAAACPGFGSHNRERGQHRGGR